MTDHRLEAHIVARLRAGFSDHHYALRLMSEAADRIEAMQQAGAAMARRLDELEPVDCPDVEMVDLAAGVVLATSTDRTAVIQLDHPGQRWTAARDNHARVLIVELPDHIDVLADARTSPRVE